MVYGFIHRIYLLKTGQGEGLDTTPSLLDYQYS